jgi:mannose-6-phosphate isomerase
MQLYPLKFEPIYKAKVWGGRSLETIGRKLPEGEQIGESWELADLSQTSASGGGGGEARSTITNGPLAGKTLHEVMDSHGKHLLGRLERTDSGDFPLLVKFLDANQNLSVQVHPSPKYAAEHDDAFLKSEAWYILDCEPDAVIYKGVKEGTTPDAMREAIETNRVEELMITIPVRPGDIHYLPSGTCHALGAGILVAEVQTPSDTTFRVYDWGREGRELHIKPALECIDYHPADTRRFEPHTRSEKDGRIHEGLVRCDYFNIDRRILPAGTDLELVHLQPLVWMVLAGRGEINMGHADPRAAATPIHQGQTLLLPPELPGATLHVAEPMTLLEVSFPQASNDLIA